MSKNVYRNTQEFEELLSDYTGAPYVVTVDNMSNAIFLALYYEKNIKKNILFIPNQYKKNGRCIKLPMHH